MDRTQDKRQQDTQRRLRALPQMDELLGDGRLAPLIEAHGRPAVAHAARAVIGRMREEIMNGVSGQTDTPDETGALLDAIRGEAERRARPGLRPVVNATGVLLHTNLGRAVMAEQAARAAADAARGYGTLEYNVDEGARGSRGIHVEALLTELTGCQAAMAVNNNAAAVMLALAALAHGREVVVSRGELVEIGGSFRVPEIMELSGCALREVGTTNKVRVSDYERAIGERTGALLKVHTSNFKVVGFTAEASLGELCALGARAGLPVIYDLGGGALGDMRRWGLDEPNVPDCVASGASAVCFSGDKLLGGPQAGLIVGQKAAIDAMRAHPLARAVRMDKMSLAALEQTLRLYRDGQEAEIPLYAMLAQGTPELTARAERIRAAAGDGLTLAIVPERGQVGGGSVPGQFVDTVALAVTHERLRAEELERGLRAGRTPVIARIAKDRVLLDMRTITAAQEGLVAQALRALTEGER